VIAILLALLHGALALTASQLKSPTFDEPTHLAAGYSYWLKNDYRLDSENGILQQRWAALPLLISRPHFVSSAGSVLRDSLQGAVAREFFYEAGNDPDRVILQGRIMIAMTAVALCLLIYYCSAELFGPIGGLLLRSHPRFRSHTLAHGALVTVRYDGCIFLFAALWSSWRLFQCLNWRRLIFAAFGLVGVDPGQFSGCLPRP